MIHIGDINDPVLRRRVIEAIAVTRGVAPKEIPHWYELEEPTYRKLLKELGEAGDRQK